MKNCIPCVRGVRGLSVLAACVMCLAIETPALAQSSTTGGPNDFFKRIEDLYREQAKEAIANEKSGFTDFKEGSLIIFRGGSSGALMASGQPGSDNSSRTKIPAGGKESWKLNIYKPTEGLFDYQESKALVNQKSEMLGSKNVIFNVALMMTEPGVKAGLDAALEQGERGMQTRLQAESHMLDQMRMNERFREQIATAFFGCVSKVMKEGKPGSESRRPATWLEAQGYCMGDRTAKAEGASSFDDELQGKQFTFEFHPKYDEAYTGQGTTGGSGSSSGDGNAIFLTDLIFSKEFGPAGAGNGSGNPDLKTSWSKVVGNLRFAREDAEAGSDGVFAVKYEQLEPEEPLEKWFNARVRENYDAMLALMMHRCKWENSRVVGGAAESEGDGTEPTSTKSYFQEFAGKPDKAYVQNVVKLSVPTYRLVPPLFDAMYGPWKRVVTGNGDIDARQRGGLPCRKYFEANEGVYSIPMLTRTRAVGADETARTMAVFVHGITSAQLFVLFMAMEDVLGRVTEGTMPSDMSQTAYQMLYRRAGTNDLLGQYERILERMRTEIVLEKLEAQGKKGTQGRAGVQSSGDKPMVARSPGG